MTNMLHGIHVLSKTVYFRSKIDLNSGLTCLMNTAISQSYIDVGDGYWRRNVSVTSLRCWRPIRDFDVFQKSHQYNDSAAYISKLSA